MQLFVPPPKWAALLTLSLCASTPLAAPAQSRQPASVGTGKPQAQNTPAQNGKGQIPKPNELTIGTMKFTYREADSNAARDFIMRGPDVRMEMTDVKRGLHIVVIADNAVGHRVAGNKNTGQVNGNVRYTLTQQIAATAQTSAGVRTVTGTAQKATYSESTQNLRLLGGVQATLNDPARFDGPAVLHCTTLNLLGEGQYEITGDPGSTDIQFTPHVATIPPAPKPNANNPNANAKPKSSGQIGNVHITGFRTGHLHENEDARFEGPLVTVETVNPLTKAQNTFKAPEITAALQKTKRRVDAKGGIQFDNRTVDSKGHAQHLEGEATTAFWSEDEARMEADGNVHATLTNTFLLKEPATLTAGHVTADMSADPRYTVTGLPEKTRLAFYPMPGEGKGKRQKGKGVSPMPAKTVSVTPPGKEAAPVFAANTPPEQDNKVSKPDTASKEPGVNNQDPAVDDAALAPPPATQNLPFAFGSIVVTRFKTATYAPGDSMEVTGPKVHFTSANVQAQNFAELTTPHLTAEFDEDNTIALIKASQGLTYKFEQPVKEHKERQWLAGDGKTAVFTNTEAARTLEVEGVSEYDFFNPDFLEETSHTQVTNKDGVINYNLTTSYLKVRFPTQSAVTGVKPFSPPQSTHSTDAKKKTKRK